MHDLNLSTGIPSMSEVMLEHNSHQPTTTTAEIDITNEEKHLLSNHDHLASNDRNVDPLESSSSPSSNMDKKQKSLVSVYDNSNDGEQPLTKQSTNQRSLPLVGILGRNPRSQAFEKRLLLSGFPKPILCDINTFDSNSNGSTNYVAHEIFFQLSPTIILLTDNVTTRNVEQLLHSDQQHLLVDVREMSHRYFSGNAPNCPSPISGTYRAFGNLSNWEIENGTQRVGVTIEQNAPLNLVKLIRDLNCFPRGVDFVDQYSYASRQIKSFRYCLFPFVATLIVFSLCWICSIIEYRYHSQWIYRQASSITGSASLTLLALLFLIRPVLESLDLLYSFILKRRKSKQSSLPRYGFVQRWLESRRYLAWYSLSLAFLHVLFLIFAKLDLTSLSTTYGFFLGLFTLILLCVLSFVHFPWISERLLWREYHLLTSYVGPLCLLSAFVHVFIHWKYDFYLNEKNLFHLKFLSMILPLSVLILRVAVYGIIRPTMNFIRWIQHRRIKKTSTSETKDPSLLLP